MGVNAGIPWSTPIISRDSHYQFWEMLLKCHFKETETLIQRLTPKLRRCWYEHNIYINYEFFPRARGRRVFHNKRFLPLCKFSDTAATRKEIHDEGEWRSLCKYRIINIKEASIRAPLMEIRLLFMSLICRRLLILSCFWFIPMTFLIQWFHNPLWKIHAIHQGVGKKAALNLSMALFKVYHEMLYAEKLLMKTWKNASTY